MYAFLSMWLADPRLASLVKRNTSVATNGHRHPRFDTSDELAQLLTQLRSRTNPAEGSLALGITGCAPGEGVSTVAVKMATTAALTGHGPVLLVEANFSRPSFAKTFGLEAQPGLSQLFCGVDASAELVQPTSISGLSVLVAGQSPKAPLHDLIHLSAILNQWKEAYPLVVVDLPPPGDLSPTSLFASHLDGILLVLESQRSQLDSAQRVTRQLTAAQANVLGVIWNQG